MIRCSAAGVGVDRPVGRGAQRRGRAAVDQFSHDHPAGDHRQVGRQAALAAKVPQHGEIVADDRQQHVGGQVLAVGRGEHDRPAAGRVIDHVNDQAR